MNTFYVFRSYIFRFFLVLISFHLFLQDSQAEECIQFSLPQEVIALKNFADDLNFHPASDQQIDQAFCARKSAFSDAEMNDWLSKNQGESKIDLTVNGISFEDESYENIEAFRDLTTYVDFRGQVDFERHKNFSSTCKKVDCALKEIFGDDISVPILFMQRRYGMNGSHLIRKPQEAQKWKREELDTLILGLSDMPDGVLPINKNHPMFRSNSSTSNGIIANATITIFNLWNDQSTQLRRATIVHELGHSISSETRISASDMFKQISGWKINTEVVDGKKRSSITCEHPEKVVSLYGKENYDEDFAESTLAYRYNPKLLKELSPEKYDLIKSTVFDGVEYTSEESCKNPQRTTDKIKIAVDEKLKSWTPNKSDIQDIAKKCGKNIVNQLFSEGKVDSGSFYLETCYNESLSQLLSSMASNELKSQPYSSHLGPIVKNIKPHIDPEIRSEIISRVKEENKTLITNIFRDIFSSNTACKDDNQIYSIKKFQKALYERDRFRFDNELKFIINTACTNKNSQSLEDFIKKMIY